MQAVGGRQKWMQTFGNSKIRSHAARSTCECAIHPATPAGLTFFTTGPDYAVTGLWLPKASREHPPNFSED